MLKFWPLVLVFVVTSAAANDFQSYRSEDGVNIELSDLHHSNEPVSFGFSLIAEDEMNGSVRYLKDGTKLMDIPFELKATEELIFPSPDDYVFLEDEAVHTFELHDGQGLIEQRTIIVDSEHVLVDLQPVPAADIGADNPITYQSYSLPSLAKSTPIDVRAPRLRSVGSEIFKKHSKSVVLIAADDGFGSGSVITEDGLIITNAHVVGEAEEVLVVFRPKGFAAVETGENFTADVIKIDYSSDLALLKLRHLTRKLNTISVAKPETIEIAEDVHAIGHPKGNYWTYTNGVISQIRPSYEWSADNKTIHFADVLQTQTPINPGNSGGPLLDDDGYMVGVNSFGDAGADGLNYAVAASTIAEFIAVIPEKGAASDQQTADPEVIAQEDTNSDGYNDVWYLDSNGNGRVDRVEQDENYDGKIDVIILDENENGKPEYVLNYVEVNGQIVMIMSIDTDEDGVRDQIAYDYDLDGQVDKIENA